MAPLLTVAALVLFVWFFRRDLAKAKQELRAEADRLRSEFELLRQEGLPTPPPNGFNMNRRPDTLRRLYTGQSMDTITAATGWALPEITLLKKIESIAPGVREQP